MARPHEAEDRQGQTGDRQGWCSASVLTASSGSPQAACQGLKCSVSRATRVYPLRAPLLCFRLLEAGGWNQGHVQMKAWDCCCTRRAPLSSSQDLLAGAKSSPFQSVLLSRGCVMKYVRPEQQKFTLSGFWKLEVWSPGVGRPGSFWSSEGEASGGYRPSLVLLGWWQCSSNLCLCLPVASSSVSLPHLCLCISPCPLLRRTPVAGTSLAVHWIRIRASIAEGASSIPGQGTKLPHAACHAEWPRTKKRHRSPEGLPISHILKGQVGDLLPAAVPFCFQGESGTPHSSWPLSTCPVSSPAAHTRCPRCTDGQGCHNLCAFAKSVLSAWNALQAVTRPPPAPPEKLTLP